MSLSFQRMATGRLVEDVHHRSLDTNFVTGRLIRNYGLRIDFFLVDDGVFLAGGWVLVAHRLILERSLWLEDNVHVPLWVRIPNRTPYVWNRRRFRRVILILIHSLCLEWVICLSMPLTSIQKVHVNLDGWVVRLRVLYESQVKFCACFCCENAPDHRLKGKYNYLCKYLCSWG